MPLENEPVFCAEQIVIPPDLGDILKAYAKEVIRNEPEDIFHFSAQYVHTSCCTRIPAADTKFVLLSDILHNLSHHLRV